MSGHREHEGQQEHSWGTAGAREGSAGRTGAAGGITRARPAQPLRSQPWETSSWALGITDKLGSERGDKPELRELQRLRSLAAPTRAPLRSATCFVRSPRHQRQSRLENDSHWKARTFLHSLQRFGNTQNLKKKIIITTDSGSFL